MASSSCLTILFWESLGILHLHELHFKKWHRNIFKLLSDNERKQLLTSEDKPHHMDSNILIILFFFFLKQLLVVIIFQLIKDQLLLNQLDTQLGI